LLGDTAASPATTALYIVILRTAQCTEHYCRDSQTFCSAIPFRKRYFQWRS